MNATRYIYIRQDSAPVGCIAYRDLGEDLFAYGYSAMHPDDRCNKASGRRIADARCDLAIEDSERNSIARRGRGGKMKVYGDTLNQKVAFLAECIASHDHTREHVRERLHDLVDHLRNIKKKDN
jgi:hypothetical protein